MKQLHSHYPDTAQTYRIHTPNCIASTASDAITRRIDWQAFVTYRCKSSFTEYTMQLIYIIKRGAIIPLKFQYYTIHRVPNFYDQNMLHTSIESKLRVLHFLSYTL